MRVWISASASRGSQTAAWIWQNKVLGGTFVRSPKLRQHAQKALRKMTIPGADGSPTEVDVLAMPQGRVIPFIRRLTKGLLYNFYPDYDYSSDRFAVIYRLPTVEVVQTVTELATKLQRKVTGQGVFRVWHGIVSDTCDNGVWIYLFYGEVCFVCFHGNREDFVQPDVEEGYIEEPGLPPLL